MLSTSDGGILEKARGIVLVLKLDAMQAFPALVSEALAQKKT